ncbi:hypothetical protein ETAA8_54130 [Anatilimnocola aggregata]|uniref:Uncharacterized protein n=1 Tax=Anatilimnocola aggregata TaxID=2528021 RepID=A0A517YJA7_9BACT|nr:hypothetical protein ETAA8_54130 [Anatilimnocola aggregata]
MSEVSSAPQLRTIGRMAAELGVSIYRINHIIATRSHIHPAARAGTLRLFDAETLSQVQYELNLQNARRHSRGGDGSA